MHNYCNRVPNCNVVMLSIEFTYINSQNTCLLNCFVASSRLTGAVIPTGSLEDNLSKLKINGGSKYEIFNPITLHLVSEFAS